MAIQTYTGGCHCGRVRYEAKLDLDGRLVTCNCSICSKTGSVLAFTPEENFKLLQGEDALTDYLFNKKVIHHMFCSTCGLRSFARGATPDGKAMYAVNLRCVDDLDVGALKTTFFDGRSRLRTSSQKNVT